MTDAPRATAAASGSTLSLKGRLDAKGVAQVWDEAVAAVDKAAISVLDLSGVEYLDGAGAALVMEIEITTLQRGGRIQRQGLNPDFASQLQPFDPERLAKAREQEQPRWSLPEDVGRAAYAFWRDFRDLIGFVGAAGQAFAAAVLMPHKIRWKDTIAIAESAGANALPIVALIGSLMGLIMAFQSAIPLQRFGADIYIADMLGIAMVRELGALVTAILLAGRSGSAFAAEIGTMKVNEEINALTTMGLNPLSFLAVPRVLAAMAVTPLLTMFFNLFALAGGAIVVMGFGYSFTTYTQRVVASLTMGDVIGGLFKAFVFSILVAGIGCHRGLSTGTGARAVGASTTSSVVSGLVLIAVADGIMAVTFYMLGI
ncbi:ABC transporter permease [Oceanidesulfovibrio indonesiensis]|uniref:ABC transporter permease n=1 Tax=Oceanidesulfovibrio indonesiensis TaxID=54767 RepID=UPI001F2CBAD9|nr:ABC transporter permease [Oceanidesulfovibrio indonesiensis]